MIEAFRKYLFKAWSRAAWSLEANGHRISTFIARAVGAVVAVLLSATPPRALARVPVAKRQMLGYRETEHIRQYHRSIRR